VLALKLLDGLDDVADDGFEDNEQGAAAGCGVGAADYEVVREAGDRVREVGAGGAFPAGGEGGAVAAGDGEAGDVAGVEAGCAEDGVDFGFEAVGGDDGLWIWLVSCFERRSGGAYIFGYFRYGSVGETDVRLH
jgi:hypothetical protein